MLDLPGIIEGASQGKGRGKQVIAVARTADLVVMQLDALKGTPGLLQVLIFWFPEKTFNYEHDNLGKNLLFTSIYVCWYNSFSLSLFQRNYSHYNKVNPWKGPYQADQLTDELEAVGIRLNQAPPDIYFKVFINRVYSSDYTQKFYSKV